MVQKIGNRIFFIGLVLLVLAAVLGHPLCVLIGSVSLIAIFVGYLMWSSGQEEYDLANLPLSRRPAKEKISRGFGNFYDIFYLAYGFAGLAELVIDRYFPNAKDSWENLPGVLKFLISIMVIATSLFIFIYIMMFIGKNIQI